MFHILPVPSAPPPGGDQQYLVQDSIKQLVLEHPTLQGYIASDRSPRIAAPGYYSDLPDSRWCKILRPWAITNGVSHRTYDPDPATNGQLMAVHALSWLIGAGDTPGHEGVIPAYVMIDELRTGSRDTVVDIWAFAHTMRYFEDYANGVYRPWVAGKWGSFVWAGRAVDLRDYFIAIDAVWGGGGILEFEFYATLSHYCVFGKDPWLIEFFATGEAAPPLANPTLGGRGDWAWQLFQNYPGARFTVMLDVTSCYAAHQGQYGTHAAWFISRQMHVLRRYTSWGAAVSHAGNGGFGSWKWDRTPRTEPDQCRVDTSTRDAAFRNSWNWYCANGNTGLEPGVGPCCSN